MSLSQANMLHPGPLSNKELPCKHTDTGMPIHTDTGKDTHTHVDDRVAKCHGYGGYIRVKKLEGWGKNSGRTHSFAKMMYCFG